MTTTTKAWTFEGAVKAMSKAEAEYRAAETVGAVWYVVTRPGTIAQVSMASESEARRYARARRWTVLNAAAYKSSIAYLSR